MTATSVRLRRAWRDLCRAGATLSAVMLVITVVTALSAEALPGGTASWPGQVLVQNTGTATSSWQLNLNAPLPAVSSASVAGGPFTVTFASAAHNLAPGFKVSLSGFNNGWDADNLTVVSVSGAAVTMSGFTTPPTANATTLGTALSLTFRSCPGDGLAGFRWSTFMVPASVDAATLTYNSTGPIAPSGVTFTQPLYSSSGSPQVAKTPAIGDARLTPIPANFSFGALVGFVTVPNGQYKIGYSCTKDGITERYWQTGITVSNSTATGFDFVASALPTTTTTTVAGSTTTTVAGSTTTTVAGSTTTTVAGATTTTVRPTTTTTALSSTTTIVGAAGPTTTIGFVTLPSYFPTTGSSSSGMIAFWAVLLLAFGRISILLARPVRVVTDKRR
jgi:hypothetical protein